MNENDGSTARGFDPDTAPDLSKDGWPEKPAKMAGIYPFNPAILAGSRFSSNRAPPPAIPTPRAGCGSYPRS